VEELRRNLLGYGVVKSGVDHRIEQMTEHFPDAMVTGYESLIAVMENQAKDRHVLAAAVRGRAELIVTENVRDFPAAVTAVYDIDVVDQDGFLLDQWDLDSVAVRRALTRQVSRYRREPRTVEDLLIALGRQAHGCPQFAGVERSGR
jgi:hypothetical protein